MKGKLMIHYAVSFMLGCLAIVVINSAFMIKNIYKEGSFYDYYPKEMISSFKDYIYLSDDNQITITEEGIKLLDSNQMGLQIIDENNQEVIQHNKPIIAPPQYSNMSLVELYSNEKVSLFLDEKHIEDTTYTYLLFFDTNKIKRITYSYNETLIKKAHKFPMLIIINIILMLVISFLYTLRITKPINRIINRILDLADGNYFKCQTRKGIYFDIEKCLNQLSDQLENNEQERKKLEEMREEWISNISHDIKTPLTSIMGNAEIMADIEYELPLETRIKCCQTILNKSEYIKTLLEELNLSTRLKSNTITLNKKAINIVSLMRHVIIDIINDEKYPSNNINFNYCSEEVILEVDERLIKRVFINLISNSFVHNSSDVKVTVNIQQPTPDRIHISIEDNGTGVSEEELKSIFRRYYRGTHTKKKIEGTGLGMAIAHDIIKVHDADIIATSKVGEGLRIEMVFYRINV